MSKIDQQIARALECAKLGDYVRAEKIVKAILAVDPTNFDALQIFGSACLERGDLRAAQRILVVALNQDPSFPPLQMNMGICLARAGTHSSALIHFDEALRLRPEYPQALFNRALSLKALSRLDEAARDIAKAVALAPDEIKIQSAYASIFLSLNRVKHARETLASALARKPRSPELLADMGSILVREGQYAEAFEFFERAVAIEPKNQMWLRRMGDALVETENFEKAVDVYARAIAQFPNDAEVYASRADALRRLGRVCEAEADRARAFETYCLVSRTRYEQGNIEGAIRDNAAALAIKPHSIEALVWESSLHVETKNFGRAFESLITARKEGDDNAHHLCDLCSLACRLGEWRELPNMLGEVKRKLSQREPMPPFTLFSLIDDPHLHKLAAETSIQPLKNSVSPRPLPRYPTNSQIRIGYFSADFRTHPVLQLISSVFGEHNRAQFHVSGFSLTRVKDTSYHKVLSSFDEFHDIFGAPREEIVLLARKKKIDIAIDLTGYTADCRPEIFALRAAAIQVNFLGFPGTMGADFMDYIIADEVLIPPELRQFYTEKVAYMPFSYMPNDRQRAIDDTPYSRAQFGLPENGFVFCCFNDAYKILPARFDIWMRILKRTEGSALWIVVPDKETQDKFSQEASARGVKPERLIFASRLPTLAAHLGRHRFADLFLDTGPFNAHTTASDALWAGLPVLTLMGRGFQARVAASLLNAACIPELITTSEEDYENLAVRLATEPDLIAAMKKKVLTARLASPLFDVTRFTADLERVYGEMMHRHRAGLPPDHIVLPGA